VVFKKHDRQSQRHTRHDYKNGMYFITICTYNRAPLFGRIIDCVMRYTEYGSIVQRCWFEIPQHAPMAHIDAFVVMPDHVHGILVIDNDGSTHNRRRGVACNAPITAKRSLTRPIRGSLGTIIGAFKSATTKYIRRSAGNTDNVWQRNYHDHIIRDQDELDRIRTYIAHNPVHWKQ
jgi:putative transposase